ncbi:ATP-binding cassette domain-containing protein [Dactylosporangium sp. NPDC048998]|uniref:ABC transporter permease subunit n=1 Tax=Dactylosporangium sp. NPDC048998 TaxID=3363976 RepID=UPI003712321F
MEVVNLVVLGLCAGAMISLSAQGVVVVFRGSGVLNLAHAAIGSLGAFVYWELDVNHSLPFPVAVMAATVVAALAGLVVYTLVIRPLHGASTLTKLVATLAVLVVVQSALQLGYGSDQRIVPNPLPDGNVALGGLAVRGDKLILLAVSVVVTVALVLVYRRTRFGLATTATAENARGAAALGMSPGFVGAANWCAGAGIAGFASAMMAPALQVQLASQLGLVVPVLAAALMGSMRSFGWTFAGGAVIGIAQALVGRYIHTPGWGDAVPLAIIIAVMVARSTGLPSRPQPRETRPRVGSGTIRPLLVVISALLVFVLLNWVLPVEYVDAVTLTLCVGLILLSSVVVTGYAGQLSLCQFALAGVGAVTAGLLVSELGLPFLLALVLGVVLAFPFALLIGAPALRTRGITFAITTLGIASALQGVLFLNSRYTGGSYVTVPVPAVFGWQLDTFLHPSRYATFALVLVVLASLMVANLRRSQTGRRLLAMRSNERAAAAVGINVYGAKLYAFALSGSIAALGGILLVFRQTSLSYVAQFQPIQSINGVLYSVVGGVGYVLGPLTGSLGQPASIIPTIFHGQGDTFALWLSLVLGLGTIKLMQDAPDGLVGLVRQHLGRLVFRRRPSGAGALAARDEVPLRVAPRALQVRDLDVRYGGVTAVSRFSCTVEPGTILGIIGPNGAGKTSLVEAVTGYTTPARGTVRLGDVTLDGSSAHARARAGLGRTFQSLELFDDLTVGENLLLASGGHRFSSLATDLVHPRKVAFSDAARAAIHEFGLERDLDRLPDELSYGRRRLVAIARSVAAGPSVLCLDEPAAGLSGVERGELAELLRRLARDWGIAIILIEHDVDLVMSVCDHITAIDFGRTIASGTPAEVRSDPLVLAAYLGAEEPTAAEGVEVTS